MLQKKRVKFVVFQIKLRLSISKLETIRLVIYSIFVHIIEDVKFSIFSSSSSSSFVLHYNFVSWSDSNS